MTNLNYRQVTILEITRMKMQTIQALIAI